MQHYSEEIQKFKWTEDNKIETDYPDLTIEAFNEDNNSKRTMTFEEIFWKNSIRNNIKTQQHIKNKEDKIDKIIETTNEKQKLNVNDDNNDKNNNKDPYMSNKKRQPKQRWQFSLHWWTTFTSTWSS